MSSTGAAQGGVVVERSGACLSVRAASEPAERWLEPMLRAEPGRTAVVVDGSATAALYALDGRLLVGLYEHLSYPPGHPPGGLRLVVGGAARSGSDGSPAIAAQLADKLGVEVVAPDGPLVVLERGELFTAGHAGAWWEFAPDRQPARAGSRFPPPAWQPDLPAGIALQPPSARVTVTPVPSGLWVRGVGGPVAELSDPAFAVPPSPVRLALLAGRPGEEPPPVAGLAAVVRALPPAMRQQCLLVPYGPEPTGAAPIAQRLADHLHTDVLAAHGLPGYAADGSLAFEVLDGAGGSAWQPLVSQSVYHPGAQPPTPWAWSPPVAGLAGAGPASFWLADGWVVDVLPSGLLVRPATVAPEPPALRRPADPQRVDIVVTAAGSAAGNVPEFVLGAIGRLARALPRRTQDRLRLLITERVDLPGVAGLAGALRVQVHRLGEDGISPVPLPAVRLAGSGPHPAAAAGHAGPGPDAAGQAGPRPDSVGRLHASAVPTASVPAAAPSQAPPDPGPATRPETSTVDEPAAPGPTSAVPGRQPGVVNEPGAGNEPIAGNEPSAGAPVPPIALPADRVPPAAHPPGPGRPPAPQPPTAASQVAADRAGGADQRWQRSSTPPERQHFRQSLGWRYDAASRYVRKILSERPSLRAAAAGDDALATDLAAVHVFATSDHTGLLESLRTGAVEQVDRAFVSCVVSGLRRLPTLTGLVVRGGPDDPAAAEAYRRGTDVLEMGLLMAVADSLAEVSGGVEVLIWSSTARRLDGLVEGPEGTKVVFLPGTVFRVLDVDAASEPRRVLLAEMPQNWRSRADAAREERIRDRLRTAAQARTAGPADKNPAGGDPAGGDPAGGDPAGGDGWPPPRRRWTSPSLVALPGLAPVQSLRSAA